jgi:hypothetical protein
METTHSSETLVYNKLTWHHIPEDDMDLRDTGMGWNELDSSGTG